MHNEQWSEQEIEEGAQSWGQNWSSQYWTENSGSRSQSGWFHSDHRIRSPLWNVCYFQLFLFSLWIVYEKSIFIAKKENFIIFCCLTLDLVLTMTVNNFSILFRSKIHEDQNSIHPDATRHSIRKHFQNCLIITELWYHFTLTNARKLSVSSISSFLPNICPFLLDDFPLFLSSFPFRPQSICSIPSSS